MHHLTSHYPSALHHHQEIHLASSAAVLPPISTIINTRYLLRSQFPLLEVGKEGGGVRGCKGRCAIYFSLACRPADSHIITRERERGLLLRAARASFPTPQKFISLPIYIYVYVSCSANIPLSHNFHCLLAIYASLARSSGLSLFHFWDFKGVSSRERERKKLAFVAVMNDSVCKLYLNFFYSWWMRVIFIYLLKIVNDKVIF